MKNTNKILSVISFALVITLTLASCGGGGGGGGGSAGKDLKYSIQVKNGAKRAIIDTDKVELNIRVFDYLHDDFIYEGRGVGLIIIGDEEANFIDAKGKPLNNGGWYSVDEVDLPVWNDVKNGKYSSFQIRITQIRINGGTPLDFPNGGSSNHGYWGIIFGKPSSIWTNPIDLTVSAFYEDYPDNFQSITINDSTASLKTVLTVDKDIIGTPNTTGYDSQGLATDPYKYIKVEGIVGR